MMRGGGDGLTQEGREQGGYEKGKVRRVCAVCQREYWGQPAQRYCSAECRSIATKEQARKYYAATRDSGGKVLKRCIVCGREFWSSPSRAAKYCSQGCKDRQYRKRKKEDFDGGATILIKGWVGAANGPGEDYGERQAEFLLEKMKKGKVK